MLHLPSSLHLHYIRMTGLYFPHLAEIQRSLLRWHKKHGLHAPWRETADPYHVLVAAVMAQQTQISRVMLCYERFLAAFPTVDDLATASRGDVIRAWAGMGYNQRAVRLHRAAQRIAKEGWPRDARALSQIDGIGHFTAAIIASFAFGEPVACVDTNVRRVLGRLSGDVDAPPSRIQRLADAALARREPARWNQAVMDYGAVICTTRPRCGECVIARWCASRDTYGLARARVDGVARMVAEERASYQPGGPSGEGPRSPRKERYEDTTRYLRGRIVDALRTLPRGKTITIGDLERAIRDGGTSRSVDLLILLEPLSRDGLVVVRGKRVSLPD
jgi:A/G-specific adenine glycosylase